MKKVNLFEELLQERNKQISTNELTSLLKNIWTKEDSKKDIIQNNSNNFDYAETVEEMGTLSLLDKEIELIKKALERSKGKRKNIF